MIAEEHSAICHDSEVAQLVDDTTDQLRSRAIGVSEHRIDVRRRDVSRAEADVRLESRLVDPPIARGQVDRVRAKSHWRNLIDEASLVNDIRVTGMLLRGDRDGSGKMRREH